MRVFCSTEAIECKASVIVCRWRAADLLDLWLFAVPDEQPYG